MTTRLTSHQETHMQQNLAFADFGAYATQSNKAQDCKQECSRCLHRCFVHCNAPLYDDAIKQHAWEAKPSVDETVFAKQSARGLC